MERKQVRLGYAWTKNVVSNIFLASLPYIVEFFLEVGVVVLPSQVFMLI